MATGAATVLFHTALAAALATVFLKALYPWIPGSVFGPVAGGTICAVVGPFISALRNLPPRSWRLMIPRRARQELRLLALSWSVLGVCGLAIVAPTRQISVTASAVLAALIVGMVAHYVLRRDRAESQERTAK